MCSLFTVRGPGAFAQKSDTDSQLKEANLLFEEGNYSEAYPLFTQLLSLRRGDPDITFKYGATLLYGSEKKAEAIPYLEKASLKSGMDVRVFYFLGRAYHLNYEFDKAINAFEKFSSKADERQKEKYDVVLSLQQCENGKELLSQIKDVIVLDRIDVEAIDFFRYYDLENLDGKILLAPEEFQSAEDKKRGHRPIIYTAPLSNIVYYSSYGKKGDQGLDIYYATRKGDGSWSEGVLLPAPINTKYNEDYPFMHSNGKVLYFSSEGHNSMGGFDVFRSRIDAFTGSYTTPENLDFAINTPDNDILYIADSLNQNAFFASGRASKQDRMSVYEVKVNLLPSSIILIQGKFLSEIDPSLKQARITIEDAQNKRQIGIFNTDEAAAYLVDFSYGGAYNFYVEAGNSGIIHSGKVEIPRLTSISAFRQELILIDDNGVERLMIKNYFEEELEGDIQALLAEALKRRAELNITPEELVADMELAQDEAKSSEKFDNLYVEAGFSFLHSNQEVANWAEGKSAELALLNNEYKTMASTAMVESQQAQENASTLLSNAQASFDLYESTDDNEVKQEALRASITQRNEAKISLLNASSTLMIADRLMEASKERDQLISEMEIEELALRQALEDEDAKAAEASIARLYELEQSLKGDRGGDQDPLDYLAEVKEIEEMKALQAFDNSEALREEKTENLALLKRLQTQVVNAKGADKEAIENEINETQASLEKLNTEIPEKWEEYNNLDWNSKVAEKGFEFANNWEKSGTEEVLLSGSIDAGMEESLTQVKEEIIAMEDLENQALLSLGVSYEELMNSEPNEAIAFTEEENLGNSTVDQIDAQESESLIENELLADYDQKVDAIRENDDRVEQLESSIVLNAELIDALSDAIENNNTSHSQEELEDLKAEVEMETVLLIDEFKKSIEDQQEATYTIEEIIPGFEAQVADIEAYGGSNLEKKNSLLDFYNITIDRLELILDSLSLMPVPEGDPFIFRQQLEYQNSVRILSTELKVKRYEIKENVELLSRVASLPTDDEMVESIDPEYYTKYETIINSSDDEDIKEAQKIQLNEALISKANNEIASLGRKMGQAAPSEIPIINAKVEMLEGIVAEKEEEINTTVLEMAKGNVSPDALISSNDQESVVLTESERDAMLAEVFPTIGQELTAIEVSNMPNNDKIQRSYDVYEKLAVSIDAKVFELEEQGSPDTPKWLALQRDINGELLGMSTYLDELQSERPEQEIELSAEEVLGNTAETWESALAYENTVQAIDMFNSNGKIAKDPGFESESLRAEASNYYANIDQINGLIDQYDALKKKETQVSSKELKKLQKEEDRVLAEIGASKISLLSNWIPLLQIANENNGFTGDYLTLSKAAFNEAEEAKGEEKADLLDEAYVLALMAMEEGHSAAGLSADNDTEPMKSVSIDDLAFQSLSINEKRRLLQKNIDQLKAGIIEADKNANEAGSENNEDLQKWNAISKTYREALVWNQDKLEELNVLEQDMKEVSGTQVAMIKAPTAPSALEQALGEIGLSSDQANLIKEDPELQTYFAMEYVQNELNDKINNTKMMRASYIENGDLSAEKYKVESTDNGSGQEAINSFNQKGKRYQEAITWYQKADSLDMLINALNVKKDKLSNDLASYYENLEAINKETIREIKNGNVPKVLAPVISDPIVEEQIAEEVFEEEEVNEPIIAEEENLAEETFIEEEVVSEELVGNDSDGFMFEAGTSFYSAQDPIPVDPPLPDGLIFKVQIGAFRNPLPAEHFVGLSPMTAEKLNNGITRYTVGIFREIDDARKAKTQVQNVGYTDAFIIAYMNGKRIPLNTALQQIGEDISTPISSVNTQNQNAQNNNTANPSDQNVAANSGQVSDPIIATNVSSIDKLFFCVQVGVFSKEVSANELFGIKPLNVELTGSGYYRYTSGRFATIPEASRHKQTIINKGIPDAFVTAYYQGTRISLSKASALLEEDPNLVVSGGAALTPIETEPVLEVEEPEPEVVEEIVETPVVSNLPDPSEISFVVFIGSYTNSIPNNVATALLENSDVGIKRAVNAGKMIYSTKELDSYTEATIILQRFQEAGVEQAKMLYVLDGNEINEQRALKILAQKN